MYFENKCGCIVDYVLLSKSIEKKCKALNCRCRDEHQIVLRNGYPAICINRKWFYVHILICEYLKGKMRKGYIVHHKDRNKLNALPNNLRIMTNQEHLQIHGKERKGIDFRSAEGKAKSLRSAKEVRTRKDVTVEKVAELKAKGLTIPEIAKELNCGVNTVSRRLSKALDWGDAE